jgi:hypothetical protein
MFTLKILIEKLIDFNVVTCASFIDLEKALLKLIVLNSLEMPTADAYT